MIDLETITVRGAGLNRPECVIAHESGLLFAADWTPPGGISVIEPQGSVWRILAKDYPAALRPNGIALEPDGSFLITHLGDQDGGVYRIAADGTVTPLVTHVDGTPLPPTNFAMRDALGRLWITVSTTKTPRSEDYRKTAATGFIALTDEHGTRIVADGLGYTNECLMSDDGRTLWVNETFVRRLTAFDVAVDGSLSNRRTLAAFGPGTFPDGLARDVEGCLWIASIVSNRLVRVHPDGRPEVMLEDADPDHLAYVEAAWQADELGRPHLDQIKSGRLYNISSLAFGGADMRTIFLGCLLGDHVAITHAPVAGVEPPHWRYDIAPILAARPKEIGS